MTGASQPAGASANSNGNKSGRSRSKVSGDLQESAAGGSTQPDKLKVVLQFNATPSSTANSILARSSVRVRSEYRNLNARVVELPVATVDELAALDEVAYISPDRQVGNLGHLSSTTGADLARASNGAGGAALDGTGIGIAILDSGIYQSHKSFRERSGGKRRISFSRDFTGEAITEDPYGHGSHVASIVGGNGRIANSAYLGIAPNATLINLRVLNSSGTGTVTNVLAALDWLLANRSTYNIRVANLSLGMPAVDSYRNDPICRAVRRLVDAGIVVVAAAGNNGKDGSGNKIYGLIHSPGNEPSALTVGASNTFGTDARNDDTVASYSSRGPTRSYYLDANGLKHYDNLLKPDLVAPGNRIIAAEAELNLLARSNPQLNTAVSSDDSRMMMYLNGTSMAAPVVAGAVALMFQANPKLTPNLIKAILMYTAQPLAGFNIFEQGAGQVNIEGAVRIARLVRTDLKSTTPVGSPLLTSNSTPTPESTIAGQRVRWSQGVLLNYGFATGTELITKYQRVYGVGVLISDGVIISNGVLISDNSILSSGVLISDNLFVSDGGRLGSGTAFSGSGVLISDRIVISDGVLISDGAVVSDGVLLNETILQALVAQTEGDATRSMPVVVDTGSD